MSRTFRLVVFVNFLGEEIGAEAGGAPLMRCGGRQEACCSGRGMHESGSNDNNTNFLEIII